MTLGMSFAPIPLLTVLVEYKSTGCVGQPDIVHVDRHLQQGQCGPYTAGPCDFPHRQPPRSDDLEEGHLWQHQATMKPVETFTFGRLTSQDKIERNLQRPEANFKD